MPEDNNIISSADQLNAALARIAKRQEQERSPAPTTGKPFGEAGPPEKDRGIFGNILKGAIGGAGKYVLGPVINNLALSGDLLSLGAWTAFGGSTSTRERSTRKQLSQVFNEGGLWSNIKELQSIQHERPGAFKGEKLLTSILLDPLTYTGFGLAGKIPLAGKLLGPIDRAFAGTANMATQGLLKGLSSMLSMPIGTLSRMTTHKLQTLVDVGKISPDDAQVIRGTWLGSQSMVMKTSTRRDEVTSAFGAALDRDSGLAARNLSYKEDATITKNFLDKLMALPRHALASADDGLKTTRDAIEYVFINNATYKNAKWIKTAQEANPNMVLGKEKQLEINDIVNDFIRGSDSFESAQASLVSKMGGDPMSGELLEDAGEFLLTAKKVQTDFVDTLAGFGPEKAIYNLGQHASKQLGEEIRSGIVALRQIQGVVGSLLNGIDRTYTTVWRNTIEKYMMRPFSEAVLAFPLYPVGNAIEDIYFMAAGGALPKGLKSAGNLEEFNRVFQGVDIPGLEKMRRTGRGGTSDIAGYFGEGSTKVDKFGRPTGASNDFSFIPSKILGREELGLGKAKVNVSILGRFWMESSNRISEMLRRGYFVRRQETNFRRLLAEAADKDPLISELLTKLENAPFTNIEGLSAGLVQKATFFAAKGDVTGLRRLVSQYTGPQIQQADMVERIAKLGPENISASSKALLRAGIDSGDYEHLTENVINTVLANEKKILDNSLEASTEWFDSILTQFDNVDIKTSEDLANVMRGYADAMNNAQRVMHANMEATFDDIGDKFGLYEQNKMAEAYEKAKALVEMLNTKGPQISKSYEAAALKLGDETLNVQASSEAGQKVLRLVTDIWAEDARAHLAHFGGIGLSRKTKPSALEWRHIRNQIWANHTDEISAAMAAATKATIDDARKLGPANPALLKQQYSSGSLAKLNDTPAKNGDLWARKTREIRQLQRDLKKLALNSRLSGDETAAIKAWIDDIADSIDVESAVRTGSEAILPIITKRAAGGYQLIQEGKNIGTITGKGTAWSLQRLDSTGLLTPGATYKSLKLAKEAATRELAQEAAAVPVQKVANLRNSLKTPWQQAIADTQKESRQAFTNYDDDYAIDYVMKHIFPFWTYAKNIWPRLIANGVAHPYANRLGGPETGYWNSTDKGYLEMTKFGVQMAPYRGLGIGRVKRLLEQEYEPRSQTPVAREIEKNASAVERYGFYPGYPWTFLGSRLASWKEGSEWEVGANLPPMMDAIVNTALVSGSLLGIEETSAVADSLRMGRFRNAAERRIAFGLGYDPTNLTPEQKLNVIKRASAFAALNSQLSLLRHRPEKYTEFQEASREALSTVISVPVEELERMADEGINIYEERPLSPMERRDLKKIMSVSYMEDVQAAYYSINVPFGTPEEQRLSMAKARMFDAYDYTKDDGLDDQMKDDDDLIAGKIAASRWRSQKKIRSSEKSAVWDAAQRQAGLTDEDMQRVNKHPQDELGERYWSVDASAPEFQDPLNGYTKWDKVTEAQNKLASDYIAEIGGDKALMLKEFQEFQLEGKTELEIKYMEGIHRGHMDWFNMSKAIAWYEEINPGMFSVLKKIEADSKLGDQMQRLAIARGDSRILANMEGRTPGERLLKNVMIRYRRNLVQRSPDIDEWLRRFYEIIP